MEKGNPQLGARRGIAPRPSGLRRLSLAMLATDKTAETYVGLPEGEGGPGVVLAAFKAAAPYLGAAPRAVQAVDWLFRFTQKQDWIPGSRPIVWPSAALQQETLGLGTTQAKALNRHLVELGLVVMRDSPNGKRYGRRDRTGRIVEAYGFDLSPLAARLAEFRAIAEKGREEREARRHLRRRATIARKGLTQIVETAVELGIDDPSWLRDAEEARKLGWRLAKAEGLDVLALGVAELERRQGEARERLMAGPQIGSEDVNPDPMEPENRLHQYNYKPNSDPKKEAVIRIEARKLPGRLGEMPSDLAGRRQERNEQAQRKPHQAGRTDRGTVLRISPDDLVRLAPRLRSYLAKGSPSWVDIVDAADWLRHDLGVSKPLWGEACLAMGREEAAIALAVVSTKPVEHFRSSPGGYFYGMVSRARAGELNLGRTLWGLRLGQEKPGVNGRKGAALDVAHG